MSQEWISNAYPDAPEYLAIKQYAHKSFLAGRKEFLHLEDRLSIKVEYACRVFSANRLIWKS